MDMMLIYTYLVFQPREPDLHPAHGAPAEHELPVLLHQLDADDPDGARPILIAGLPQREDHLPDQEGREDRRHEGQ